jgi:hypothetical protein
MIQVFLDESGIHNGAPICVIAGYHASERQWKRLGELWTADGCEVEFHAKRFFARSPEGKRVSPYADWDDRKANDYLRCRLDAISTANIYPVGAMIDVRAFRAFSHDERRHLTGGMWREGKWRFSGGPSKPYYLVFQDVVIQSVQKVKRPGWQAHFVVAEQNELVPLAAKLYALMKRTLYDRELVSLMGEMRFASPKAQPGLQAADLLAYCWYQYRILGHGMKREADEAMKALMYKGDEMRYFSAESMAKLLRQAPMTPGITFNRLKAFGLEARLQNFIHQIELITVVEAEREFVKVQRQVLRRDFMEHAHDAALEEAPNILAAIGVNVAINVPLRVVHGMVRELGAIEPQIRGKLISVHGASRSHVLTNETSKHARRDVLDSLHTDFA